VASEPNRWTILKLPSIDDSGSALWPERYSVEDLRRIESTIGKYGFEALYQCNPSPREGSFFKVSNIEIVDEVPAGMPAVRAWDVAHTEGDGDFTAGVRLEGPHKGIYYVTDVVRGQWATDERDAEMRLAAGLDGLDVKIIVPEDPSSGKSLVKHFIRLLAGFPVYPERPTVNKVLRADPLSSQVNAGNLRLKKGAWNKAFIEELRQFPNGKHDDQVDAAADAFAALASPTYGWDW
jgi:predicted phage terminase large subunit-like protein